MKPLRDGGTHASPERPAPDPGDGTALDPRARVWLERAGTWVSAALIVGFFGLPLFRGLNNTEFGWDEPIYSFAVDKILENGDWLTPRAIPSNNTAFLEKPPLKFWIVAATIRSGLAPRRRWPSRSAARSRASWYSASRTAARVAR